MKDTSEITDIKYEETKSVTEENIKINVKQAILLKHGVNVIEYFMLREISKIKEVASAKYFYKHYPSMFRTKRAAKDILDLLTEDEFLSKEEDRYISGQSTISYSLTKLGHTVVSDKIYVPKYSLEYYLKSVQIINHWNSYKMFTSHSVKPFGEVQSSTVESSICYISGLLEGKVDWYEFDGRFTLDEICKIIDTYTMKWDVKFRPEDKSVLPKSLKEFFLHYKKKEIRVFQHPSIWCKRDKNQHNGPSGHRNLRSYSKARLSCIVCYRGC